MAKKKKDKSKGVVDADGKRWYNSIDPGIDTSWGSAIYNGPGILFRLVTGVKRDEFSPEYEENLWKAYTMGGTDGLPKSNVRFDGEDLGDADVVGLPQEQAVIVQSIADTLYAKQIRDKVRNKLYSSPGEDEAMRRKAIEYQDVAEKILNSPGEWVSIREGSSPVREFKKVGKREVGFTGLGGLKNFDVRWNPKESTLDVRDEYDFKDEGVEGNIPRRDRRLFIRDRIKFYPEKGGVFYRNPKKVEEMGYRSRFEEGGIVVLKPEDGISLYYVPVMEDGGDVRKPSSDYYASRDNTSVGGRGTNANISNVNVVNKGVGDAIISVGTSLIPVLGEMQDFSDFVTAKESGDNVGMLLSALSFIPLVGSVATAANKSRKIKRLTSHTQGDEAVKMFKEYGKVKVPENSELGERLMSYIPEIRRRYGITGNEDISDNDIVGSLYKHAVELSGDSKALNDMGEPLLLFRGDTRSYDELLDRISPEDLVGKGGTMDNALGTLFLNRLPRGGDKEGVDRYLNKIERDKNGNISFVPSVTGSGIVGKSGKVYNKPVRVGSIPEDAIFLYKNNEGTDVFWMPTRYSADGSNDINAFVVRTPELRNSSREITLYEPLTMFDFNYFDNLADMSKYRFGDHGFLVDEVGNELSEKDRRELTRRILAEHYTNLLESARRNREGLIGSGSFLDERGRFFNPFRGEHGAYEYYALPNFNKRNAKHILPYDLRNPVDWSDSNIYREEGGDVDRSFSDYYASRDNTSVGGPGIDANANYGQRISPQFNIGEAIANFTPVVGDAVDVKDLIESYSNKDWMGMGLAAAGFIPIGGDLLQEYNKLRRRKFLDEIPINKSSGNEDLPRRREDIDETDEELLDKMPSYAHPQSPNTNVFVMHERRLDNGAYERITGRLRDDFVRNARDLEQLYPGIYKRIFDIDKMSVDDEDLDAFLEMFYMRDRGTFSGESKEKKLELLDNAKDKVFNESPMYKIGLNGDNAIVYGRNSFVDKFGNEDLEGRINAGLSHELDHAVQANASKEYLEKMSKEADGWFDDDLVRESGRSTFSDRMELAARGSQIKDYFGLVDDAQEVTPEMLKYAARNYDTRWMDNNMLDFFSGIKDWDKAAKWITKYSTVTLPAAAIPYFVDESKSEYEKGGEIDRKFNLKDSYNLGDYVQPEDGSSKHIGYQPFYSVPFFYKRVKYIENRLNKDYGFSPYEAEDAVSNIIPKSMLDDGYYDVKNNTYGIGQWGGADLKRFKAMYNKGGLDDQIDFLAKEYKKKNGGSINNMDDLYRYLRGMHVKKEGGLVEKQDELYSTLTEDYGMNPIQAIAVIANLTHESNLDETILGDSGASLGLQQWRGERRDALESFAFEKGHPVPTFDDQIEFLMNEYNSGQAFQFNSKGQNLYAAGKTKNPTFDYYQYSKSDFDKAENLYDAVIAWNQGVGRPSKKYAYNDRRYNIAKKIADRHGIKYSNKSYFGEMGMNPEWVDVDASFVPVVTEKHLSDTSGNSVSGEVRAEQSAPAYDSRTGNPAAPGVSGEPVLSGEEMFMQQYGNAIVQQMLAADMKYTRINDQSSELAKRQEKIASDARKESESIRESEQQRREREFLASILPSIQLNVKGVSRN